MPGLIITGLEQVTIEWLTMVLSKSGALRHGAVAAFEVDTGRGNWSTSARLELRYADRLPLPTFTPAQLAAVGDLLCVAGLAFAVWARLTLGRSWGMPMTLHEQPELVTAGPYRYVRHPIYTGVTVMLIGTALVFPPAVLPGAILTVYFVFSALREERDMAARFPDAYAAYKERTRMLVPFVL